VAYGVPSVSAVFAFGKRHTTVDSTAAGCTVYGIGIYFGVSERIAIARYVVAFDIAVGMPYPYVSRAVEAVGERTIELYPLWTVYEYARQIL
jgi:hypothetical protein